MKIGSLSDTIERDMPWRRVISLVNNSATDFAEYGCLKAKKCPYLDKRSITTMITEYPCEFGSPSMKSIDISSQIRSGIGSGCSNPAGVVVSYL